MLQTGCLFALNFHFLLHLILNFVSNVPLTAGTGIYFTIMIFRIAASRAVVISGKLGCTTEKNFEFVEILHINHTS